MRDRTGALFEGVPVTFTVTAGGGVIQPETVLTDENGKAQSTLTLGSDAGTNTVHVNVEGISQMAVFSAEASLPPPMPMALEGISGDNQNDLTGETLMNPFVVEVRDQYDDPMEGVTVTFAVSAGGGLLSHEMGITDANGRAESTLTLGSDPGTNTVKVSVEGIVETTTFNAEANLPPPIPTSLEGISGNNQTDLTGERLMNPFVVEVRDQYDDPMEGVTIAFVVSAGGGLLSHETVLTDANGQAESTLTLGIDPGTNTVEVSVEGIAETTTFNAVAELREFDLSVPAGLNLIHIPLKVAEVDGGVQTITSIADLYNALGGASSVNLLITYDPKTGKWFSYAGTRDKGTSGDKALTDDTGIIAVINNPVTLRLSGNPLGTNGNSTITLNRGVNLLGVPLRAPNITRVSDLFTLEGIGGNVASIIVSDNEKLKVVGRADDDGDIPITGGQSFILTAREATRVVISGTGWTNVSMMAVAPPVAITGIKGGNATPVLALRGSIVDEGTHMNRAGFRIILKNLSTGKTVTDVIGDEYLSPG